MDRPAPDRPRTPAQQTGDAAEAVAERRLTESGWTVLARNVRVGRDELDLVAIDPGPPRTLVIVEVRWRRRRDFGLPEETFGYRKRSNLRRALGRLLEDGLGGGRLPELPIRIDLVVLEPGVSPAEPKIRHHRDALAG